MRLKTSQGRSNSRAGGPIALHQPSALLRAEVPIGNRIQRALIEMIVAPSAAALETDMMNVVAPRTIGTQLFLPKAVMRWRDECGQNFGVRLRSFD